MTLNEINSLNQQEIPNEIIDFTQNYSNKVSNILSQNSPELDWLPLSGILKKLGGNFSPSDLQKELADLRQKNSSNYKNAA